MPARFPLLSCVLLAYAAMLSGAATLTLTPAVIYDCPNGDGVATLTWSGASGPVKIVVGQPTGPSMTGFNPPSGSAMTNDWVTNGEMFYLVNQAGGVEASVAAQVNCGATPRTIDQGLAGGSYFPLAVGNTWVYKYNDRLVTAAYNVTTITGTQMIGGQTYYVLTLTTPGPAITLMLLRGDNNGVIYQYASTGDQIYLDPNAAGVQQSAYSGPLGTFSGAIAPPAQVQGGLIQTTSIFVRGIGLVNSQSDMLTGSSGGFTSGYDLVVVRVDGIHLSVPAPKIGLSIESTTLDLTDKLAPNCAVPCYFAACGVAPGADPPGTYRPCAQSRIDTSAAAGYSVLLHLLDPGGSVVFQNSTQVTSTTSLDYVRLPLYTGPNNAFTLLPPGDYKLLGSILNGNAEIASSSITVHIQ
jgi:hypothetical protein